MKYILFDDISGIILGVSFKKEEGNWYTQSDEAYNAILANNGLYRVLLDKVTERLEEYNKLDKPSDYIIVTMNEISKEPIHDMDIEIEKKIVKAKKLCNMDIEAGIRYNLNGKGKRYTYKIEDQINFEQLMRMVDTGIMNDDTGILVKTSGEIESDILTVNEFKSLYNALLKHKFYNLHYLSQYILYVKTITDFTELSRLQYRMLLPDEYMSKINECMIGFA